MAKITPSVVARMTPVDDVVNHSIRYLKVNSDPSSKHRIVLLPFGHWSDCGISIGRGIDSLDFPDNSIMFIDVRRSESPSITLPPSNSVIDCQWGPSPSVDNGVIDHIYKNIGSSCSFSIDDIERSDVLVSLPMAIETSKMRRKGIPLCTPVIIGVPHGDDGWGDLPPILWEMIDGFGLGAIIHSKEMTIPKTDNGSDLIKGSVSSLVPDFVRRAVRRSKPGDFSDIISTEMFQRLVWETDGTADIITVSKSVGEDGRLWEHHVFGMSEGTSKGEPVPPSERGLLWRIIHSRLSGAMEEVSADFLDVDGVIIEVKIGGVSTFSSNETSNFRDALMGVEWIEEDFDWEKEDASIEIRIHYDEVDVLDIKHFRPKQKSSMKIKVNGEEEKIRMIPPDMRMRTNFFSSLGEVERASAFSVQTLSSPRCLLLEQEVK